MSKPSNTSPGAGSDLQINGSSKPGDIPISGDFRIEANKIYPWPKTPVGHYAILDGLVYRCLSALEKQQPDADLGQIGVNVTMAATTGEDGTTVPALLYLFLADGAVYGQALMTTILDATLRPDEDRLTSVVNSALDEIRHQQTSLVEALVGETGE